MNNDTTGYIPNLSAKISTMSNVSTFSMGDVVSTTIDFLPCTISRFQPMFTALYSNSSWFKIHFYFPGFMVGTDRYSYLGMSLNATNWPSYFAGNVSVISLAPYGQVIKNASFFLEGANPGNYGSDWRCFYPIYTLIGGTRSALVNDYEPFEI